MSSSLLSTKLYIPPVRPKLVPCPRLIERLNAGLYRKLTLVSAPAGFGKTTLLSEWVADYRKSKIRVAWLSLDADDNDPARFLAYLIAAFRTIEENVGRGALGALQSPGFAIANTPPPMDEILTMLINQVNVIPDDLILVLDDYHLFTAPPVHDALSFLLDHHANRRCCRPDQKPLHPVQDLGLDLMLFSVTQIELEKDSSYLHQGGE